MSIYNNSWRIRVVENNPKRLFLVTVLVMDSELIAATLCSVVHPGGRKQPQTVVFSYGIGDGL